MKGKFLKIAVVGTALLLCIFAVACQGQSVNSSNETAMDVADKQQEETEALGSTVPDGEGTVAAESTEEWPGQAKGYIGPNGEGGVVAEEFATEEEYSAALIEAGSREVEVPDEQVWIDDGAGYAKGMLTVAFYRRDGEQAARAVVEGVNGVWVSSTFAWVNGDDETAMVSVYFPDAPYLDDLKEIAEELRTVESVHSAYPCYFEAAEDADSEDSLAGYSVNDAGAPLQNWLMSAGFKRAWEVVRCDGCVEIAVLDTGMDLDHEDLLPNLGTTLPYDAYNQGLLQGSTQDASGHGTMVAGIVSAAANNGVGIAGGSFNAKIIPVRVMRQGADDNGDPLGLVEWDAVERALSYLDSLTNKPEVINMSFGGTRLADDSDPDIVEQRERLQTQLSHLRDEEDIVLVATSGNKGTTTNAEQYPAKFDGVFVVGAVDGNGTYRSTSTRNATVDMCALGEDVLTTLNPDFTNGGALYGATYSSVGNNPKHVSGTSFAAPQVAAVAALLKAQDPNRSADDIEDILVQNAKRPSDFIDAAGGGASGDEPDGKDDDGRYGYGALDAAKAVGWTAGGTSPFTGPGDDMEALDEQVGAQERLQATGASDIPGALAAAMEANPDVFAWLYVPATNLSLPVAVRERGDSFYLDHGAGGEPNVFGCAFSGGGSRDMADPVTAVYGHSFSDVGLAFTELHKFEDYAFFAGHEKVYLYLPGKRLEYRVVGANLFNARAIEEVDQSDAADLGDYFAELSNPDPDAFMGFKRRFSLDAANDRVLQLSTCTVPADPAHRFVVTCVLEGER